MKRPAVDPHTSVEHVARDPVCGMAVERVGARHTARHEGQTFYFLLRPVQGAVYRRAGRVPRRPPAGPARARGQPLHLPDGPRDRAGHAGRLLHLRHGAGADDACGRCGTFTRASRPAPAALARRTARRRRVRVGDGEPRRHSFRLLDRPAALHRAAMPAGDARALDRTGLLPAGSCFGAQSLAQHVDPDRARHGRGLALQPRRRDRTGRLPCGGPHRRRAAAGLLRGGGGDPRARAGRAGDGNRCPRADGRCDPRAHGSRAEDGTPVGGGRRGRCAP